jgi:sugar-specific transcriptional regulator TrmB
MVFSEFSKHDNLNQAKIYAVVGKEQLQKKQKLCYTLLTIFRHTMNKELTNYLAVLGISEDEAAVYFTLLQTGPLGGGDLAETLGIPRTTVYNYLHPLQKKELVMKLIRGSRALFSAVPPDDVLPHLVAQQVQASKTLQDKLTTILALFRAEFSPQSKPVIEEAEIRYYKGKLGVRKIYEQALQAKELRSYVNIAIMFKHLPENSRLFANALKTNKELTIFELIEDSDIAREQTKLQTANANYERYFYKFLPKAVKLSAADTLIYDGKVAVINVGSQFTGVVFQNSDHFNNLKALFESYWNMLPNEER